MNDEQYAEIIGALRANEQEHSSYNRRLHEHDEKIDKLQQTQIQLANLTNAVNNLASGIGEVKTAVQSVDKRVGELEREPADKWKKITWEIVKAVVMAAVGAGIAILTRGA
jgi:chromosome segregation ATPase